MLFDFARRRAEIAPDRLAFIEAASGRRLTYRDFDERAERAAFVLWTTASDRATGWRR